MSRCCARLAGRCRPPTIDRRSSCRCPRMPSARARRCPSTLPNPGVISPLLPAGANLIDGFAVGWSPVGTAAKTLTLTVNDAAITASCPGVRNDDRRGASSWQCQGPGGRGDARLHGHRRVSSCPPHKWRVHPPPAVCSVPRAIHRFPPRRRRRCRPPSSPTTNYTQLVVALLVLLVLGVTVLAIVARRRRPGSSR